MIRFLIMRSKRLSRSSKTIQTATNVQRSDVSVSKLVPEQPLVISPTLAATIGLGEAVMLQVLAELIRHRGQQRTAIRVYAGSALRSANCPDCSRSGV